MTAGDRAIVGGKAWHLARLAERGVPVPPAFVVPASVFVRALEAAGLHADAVAAAAGGSNERRLHDNVMALSLQRDLAERVRRAARALVGPGGGGLAVRSSGVEEDGRQRSFAGQHLTELQVAPDDVPAAIVRCWASLYGAAAAAYRAGPASSGAPGPARVGAGPVPGGMAVLVQRMVRPRAAGVMFTVNPLSGSWREMVVEATWGLGESLVSGAVTPHWYLVRRPRRAPKALERLRGRAGGAPEGPWSAVRRALGERVVRLAVVQQDLPDIERMLEVGSDGALSEVAVPAVRRGAATLDRHALFRLCRLGLDVEARLGAPQDVEWAVDDGGALHVLQARPITSPAAPRPRTDVLWTRRFIGERWQRPATPLGWSIVHPILEWFIAYPEVQARYLGGGPALRLVRSRPYVNATVFRYLAFKAPGAPPPGFLIDLLPPEEVEALQRAFAQRPGVHVYAAIFRTTFEERRWRRFRWNPFTNHLRWDEYLVRLQRALVDLDRPASGEKDGLRKVEAGIELVRDYVGVHVTSLLFANMWYQILEGLLATWAPDRAVGLLEGLGTCPPGNLTLEINHALWSLARRCDDAALDALERGDALPAAFAAALQEFLSSYGHRSSASWEIFAPRWAEDPAAMVPLLRAHRRATGPSPEERAAAQEVRYTEAFAELGRTTDPVRRVVLRRVVALTRAYLLLRENQRFWFDRLLAAIKRALVSVGASLTARGALGRADDVAFLTWVEVRGLCDGTLPLTEAAPWVSRRRERYDADCAAPEPPVFLRGDEAIEEVVAPGARLQGLGVSPGRARGRVRVVRSLADGQRLQPGEILVARATDPSWTPLFLASAGVVLELGSRLSHGAVVAREYRVPAVVNVDGATRLLVDGQEVTIDGTRGAIWVHP